MDASGCPWSSFRHASGGFCEESLCAWIRQPGNTWSNIGFIVAGLFILWQSRRADRAHLAGLGWVAIATGIGSAFYHASETFVGQIADWVGMYLGSVYMLSSNVRRAFHWGPRRVRVLFWSMFVVLLAGMIRTPRLAHIFYAAQSTFCCVGLELFIFRKQGRFIRYRWLLGYWLAFLVAYGLWYLDIKKIVCDPRNHVLSGHAAWHLLNAVALFFLYLYYLQFDSLRFRESKRPEPFVIGS